MASPISANRAELLAIATSVATEKMIDKSIVIEAMEEAIQRAARARYGSENDIRAKLDPKSGDLRLWRVLEVVEAPEDPDVSVCVDRRAVARNVVRAVFAVPREGSPVRITVAFRVAPDRAGHARPGPAGDQRA